MPEDKDTKKQETERVMPVDARLQRPEQLGARAMSSLFVGLAGALALIIGLLWWLVTKVLGVGPKAFLIIAVVCLVYVVAVNFRAIVRGLGQRRTASGLNAAAFAVMVLGILVILNIIGGRHSPFRYDASQNKQFSLSPQTVKVLKSLNQDVNAYAFFSREYPEQQTVRDRLEEYRQNSPRFKITYYDPKTRVDKDREFNITMDGTVVLKCGEKKEEVLSGEEERLTSALLAVTTGKKTKVYFLTGHGEVDLTEAAGGLGQGQSIAEVKKGLEAEQYDAQVLTLVNKRGAAVPQDAAALVIAGAQHPLQPAEMAAVEKYVDQGGKLLLALATGPDAPGFESILRKRGVTPLGGRVMDPSADHNAGAPEIPAVLKPESHQITARLQDLVLPLARPLKVESSTPPPPAYPGSPPPPENKKAVELLKTSPEAWNDKMGPGGKYAAAKQPGDETGPFAMAAAIDESTKQKPPPQQPGMPPPPEDNTPATGTRIVVIGDCEFMTDQLVRQFWANGALVLNAVSWLVGNEKLISIPPKPHETPYLAMVGAQKVIAAIIALFIMPGAIIITGGLVWWRRRR